MADSDNHEELSSEMRKSSEDEGAGEGKVEGSPEEEGKSEEELYTLLFSKVDSDSSGQVPVDSLVDYLHQMKTGAPQGRSGREEVYDSQEDAHQVVYNLQLLKAMLEVSAVDGCVDQATYSHVIRLWVKDVRERSNQQAPALEVSQLSDSEEDDDDGVAMAKSKPPLSFVAEESFETSGGNSSSHSALDRLDLLTSLQDVRLDNRRLAERERQLQASLDVSEEQLRSLQTENTTLQHQLHSVQQQLLRLEAVERDNTLIGQSLKEEGLKCGELTGAVEKMNQDLCEAQKEVTELRHRISEREMEREQACKEAQDLQQQLVAQQEALDRERERCAAIQAQLSNMASTEETMRSKVMELEESNMKLQSENIELHSIAVASGPAYSTPSRAAGPPSLHEELSHHGNFSGQALPSPLVGLQSYRHNNKRESCRLEDHYDNSLSRSPGNLSMEDLEQIAQSSSNKFHSKTEVMVRLLSELLNSSRPPSSTSPPTSHSSESITEVTQRRQQRDSNLRQLVASIKKLYGEKKQLKQQVAELQDQLQQQQQRQQVKEEVDAAIQTTPTGTEIPTPKQHGAVVETSTQTGLPPTEPLHLPPTSSCFSTCMSVVGGVVRGVVWTLLLVVMVLLLLAVLVWYQHQLHPCHGNCLTPGAMVWAVVQPHITVTRHGYI